MLRRFARDERGNFAIITGLMATVLIGAMGGVMDLSAQWTSQSAVQRAADAAALAGAKALENGTEQDAQQAVQIVGQANIPEGFPAVTFVAKIDQTAGTVSVSGVGETQPIFLNLFQIRTLSIGADAQALIQRKSYIDFYFLLDVSESMNIAASDTDRALLEKITRERYFAFGNREPRPCAFACHTPEWGSPTTVYQLSQSVGAKLRIDVLRKAADSMIDKILSLNSQEGSLKSTRIATNGFSEDFKAWMPPSTHADLLKRSIRNTDLASAHTNQPRAFSRFDETVGKQGTGKSATDVRKFALIVTDGVRDEAGIYKTSADPLGTFSVKSCEAMKARGIDVAVLEIKYQKYVDQYNYFGDRVANYYGSISPTLKDCASPSLYYQATDSDQAESQLLKMVDILLSIRRRLSS